jgi:hypothetical protein
MNVEIPTVLGLRIPWYHSTEPETPPERNRYPEFGPYYAQFLDEAVCRGQAFPILSIKGLLGSFPLYGGTMYYNHYTVLVYGKVAIGQHSLHVRWHQHYTAIQR